MLTERRTPEQVWREMQRGNARFVAGEPQHPRKAVDRVRLATGAVTATGIDALDVAREHLRDTVGALLAASELIGDEVAAGTLGIVGANYRLREGRVVPDVVVGQL